MIPQNLTYEQLLKDMESCDQTKGMSVLDHGDMVKEYFLDLYNHLYNECKLEFEWKLPEWLIENKNIILNHLYHEYIIQEYLLLHDCGKPYCRIVDEEGKQHFPNHANVSFEVYSKFFPEKSVVCQLILMDMDIHKLKSEEVSEFSKRPEAITLLIAGLCEIHANASMFGGIESDSFKIKFKQINKKGKSILFNLK
jgi:hypothetical protein